MKVHTTGLKILAILFSIVNLSCESTHFYRPKPNEPVLLTHKNQTKINFINHETIGALSAAYSPTQNLGIHLSMGFGKDGGAEAYEKWFNPSLALGYYKQISGEILVEMYAGAGIYNHKNNTDDYVKGIKCYNYFVHPSIAYINENVEIAFTIRGDYLKRYDTELANYTFPDTSDSNYSFLNTNNYFFIQPGATLRFGFRYIKFQLQVMKSYPLSSRYKYIYGSVYDDKSQSYVPDNSLGAAGGLTIDLDLFKKKKHN